MLPWADAEASVVGDEHGERGLWLWPEPEHCAHRATGEGGGSTRSRRSSPVQNLGPDFGPRARCIGIGTMLAKSFVEERSLVIGERKLTCRARVARDAVPKLFDQLETFRDVELEQVCLRDHRHANSLARRPDRPGTPLLPHGTARETRGSRI